MEMAKAARQQTREELLLTEAVPLCLRFVMRLLDSADVRALAVKGPAFAALGIRSPRVSSDADVLVNPTQQQAALACLKSSDWRDWAPDKLLEPFGAHSITLEHDLWPCSLDLHWRFPGFLAPASELFELLWAGRANVEVAHQQVATLSRPHALALECLHVLRETAPAAEESTVRAVVQAMPQPLNADEVRALGELLGLAGAAQTLEVLARCLGASDTAPEPDESQRADLEQWRARQRSSAAPLAWWFTELRNHPLRALGRGVRHAWLSDGQARTWAKAKGVDYRSRWQVLRLRGKKGVHAVKVQLQGWRPGRNPR